MVLEYCRYNLPERFNRIFDIIEAYILTRTLLDDRIKYNEDTNVGNFFNQHWVKLLNSHRRMMISISCSMNLLTKKEDSGKISISNLNTSEIEEITIMLKSNSFDCDFSVSTFDQNTFNVKFSNSKEFESLFTSLERYLY